MQSIICKNLEPKKGRVIDSMAAQSRKNGICLNSVSVQINYCYHEFIDKKKLFCNDLQTLGTSLVPQGLDEFDGYNG